jgi:hypothetical protein
MKNFFKKTLGVLGLVAMIYSCKQDNPLGPELASVNDSFNPASVVLTADTEFDSDNANPNVSSSWGQHATYELMIKGAESGAVKTYKGTASSFSTMFDGLSSNIYLFKSGELASVELKLIGHDSIFVCSNTIKIKKPFKFDGQTKDGISYFLIDGFDGKATIPLNSGSPSIDQKDVDVSFDVTSSMSIQGSNSLYLAGTDLNNNSWCGDVNHEHLGDLLNKDTNQLADLPIDSGIDPANLYFNAFIYGTGAKSTAVEFKIAEIDGGDTLKNRFDISKWIKGDSTARAGLILTAYSTSDNDSWIFDVIVDWEGWKLVSIPYSQFRAANDPTNGGGGDRVKESFRISGVTVSLLSFPEVGASVSTYVDCIMLTTGGKANYN